MHLIRRDLRSKRLLFSAPFVALLPLAYVPAPTGAQDFSKVEIGTQRAQGKVHMLTGQGGNLAVLGGPDGLVLIDSQFAPLAPKIRAALDALPETERGTLRFLINTHFHGDHTGGNAALGASGAIVAHANVRARLAADAKNSAQALPSVTFEQGLSLYLNGERMRIEHVESAHTDSDSVVYFEDSKVVHTGDLFFHQRFPFVDLKSGGSVKGLIAGVERVLARLDDAWAVVPGHGPLAQKRDLQAYRDMLVECLGIVQRAHEAGTPWAEFSASKPLAKYVQLNWEFISDERFLATLADEVGWRR